MGVVCLYTSMVETMHMWFEIFHESLIIMNDKLLSNSHDNVLIPISYCDQQKRAWIWNKYCSPLVNDEAPCFLHDYAYVDVILMTCKLGMTIPYRIWYVIELNKVWMHWFYMR